MKPPRWFWAAISLGLAIRIYLVLFTNGTYDVGMWQADAIGVQTSGLIGHYHSSENMTRPPFIAHIASGLWSLSENTGIPFRILLRAPIALLDCATAILLLCVLRDNRHRFLITAAYWLNPLAIIFSSYHGNVDSSVAFFLILCLFFFSREKVILAGAAIGISLWVKPPTILAIPAFLFAFTGWRRRLLFLAAIGVVGISTYIPSLLQDAAIVYQNVFGYHGKGIQTASGIHVWGLQIFIFPLLDGLSPQWQQRLAGPVVFLLNNSWLISILLIILLSWLRRSQRTVRGLGATIAMAYSIVYGLSYYWSFQYLAWSIPFWFFVSPAFLIAATLLTTGYIYSLYWFLCGNPWLLGEWDFAGHPDWPSIVIIFRNLSVLFFFLSACIFLAAAIHKQITRLRKGVRYDSPQADS